jgi:hypothetical protein
MVADLAFRQLLGPQSGVAAAWFAAHVNSAPVNHRLMPGADTSADPRAAGPGSGEPLQPVEHSAKPLDIALWPARLIQLQFVDGLTVSLRTLT